MAGLLGMLGAFVTLGIKELGAQLDQRLNDREVLTCLISETVPKEQAVSRLETGVSGFNAWHNIPGEAKTYYLAAAYANVGSKVNLPVLAVENMEEEGLVDDFFVLSSSFIEKEQLEFSIGGYRSEATVIRPEKGVAEILQGREAVFGGIDRLAALFVNGFTEKTVLKADSVEALAKAEAVVAALARVEGRRIFIQSNLKVLRELEKIRAIQAQALIWVTIGSGLILGLVFGSLAWMEFREERYLLALIRSFGVARSSLLAHALVENTLLSVGGVLLGFGCLRVVTGMVNLNAMNLEWLGSSDALYGKDGLTLLFGAALGGLLSAIPIAVGLRKPLGLVLT